MHCLQSHLYVYLYLEWTGSAVSLTFSAGGQLFFVQAGRTDFELNFFTSEILQLCLPVIITFICKNEF